MAIYLLVKEHAYTGLKYLCKHVASSFSECEEIEGHTYKMIWDRLQNDSSWRYIKFL
jgi:hypothetical protein